MTITFKEYQQGALETAQFPTIGHRVVYPVVGLCGEAGELLEQIKKMYRDDDGVMTAERFELIKKELGDILWYVVIAAHEFHVAGEHLLGGYAVLNDFQLGVVTEVVPGETFAVSAYPRLSYALRLMKRAAEVGYLVDASILAPQRYAVNPTLRDRVAHDLTHVMRLLALIGDDMSLPLADVAAANLEKLASRKDRGKIGGSGDNR